MYFFVEWYFTFSNMMTSCRNCQWWKKLVVKLSRGKELLNISQMKQVANVTGYRSTVSVAV